MKLRSLLIPLLALPALASAEKTNSSILTPQGEQYLEFLYSRMPVADSIDHPRSFWEENVAVALKAREEMPWGKTVPEREFRHFVLPVRVNNEDLDSSRMVFYRELAPRVKGMSMKDAALEVNHWLHEKANYRPSDSRTSSPLATMRTTWGRCGEESTFGVAAMRSVGIPARQVYTPRWAHTDDNHAWVEVWIDGKWHFLGACEPEPILDLAWFNAPAARGMLMATNAFGHYDGPEQQLYQDSCYTRINITDTYAPLRRAEVKVVNPDGTPAAGAPVSFRLYNYGELYPLFSTRTDANGMASLLCGFGDITAWASDPATGRFGVVEIEADAKAPVTLTLSADGGLSQPLDLTLTPPAPSGNLPKPTEAQIAENARRFAYEDSLRNTVNSRFFNEATAREWINNNLTVTPADPGRIAAQLVGSYGNYPVISEFFKQAKDPDNAALFLSYLSEKDLRDVAPEVLADSYTNRLAAGKEPVLPRVANELLTPFCGFFDSVVPENLAASWKENPSLIPLWISENIATVNDRNPNRLCISPEGVWTSRMADSKSKNIFFVALCRWLGIPARINAVTGLTEWGEPMAVIDLESTSATAPASGLATLNLTYPEGQIPADPAYYIHFTLSSIDNNGEPQLLNYDESATLGSLSPLTLAPGRYLLTTGRRMANGSVLARLELLDLKANETVTQPLTITDNPNEISVIGSFNADPLLPITGRGYFILAMIAPGHEPSSHLLNELVSNRQAIEQWGKKVVLLFATEEDMAKFDRSKFAGLPENVVFGVDTNSTYLNALAEEFGFDPSKSSLPALIVGDTFNRVVFMSTGYNVGLGERIASMLPRLKE